MTSPEERKEAWPPGGAVGTVGGSEDRPVLTAEPPEFLSGLLWVDGAEACGNWCVPTPTPAGASGLREVWPDEAGSSVRTGRCRLLPGALGAGERKAVGYRRGETQDEGVNLGFLCKCHP